MTAAVETLGALERKILLTIPREAVRTEVQTRLRKVARTAKADGFRVGKVPMNIIEQRYGYQVEYEVMQDKVADAFVSAADGAKLRVAGAPRFEQAGDASDAANENLNFAAIFEVYPEVKLGDLSKVEVERVATEVTDEAVDKTIDILRKQRRSFYVRGEANAKVTVPASVAAETGDRVSVDFVGKLDGVAFDGGSAEDFQFLLGEKQMLPEFETAVVGMKKGDEKSFDLPFPADYHSKDLAGKTAQFTVTLKSVEWPFLPEMDAGFVKSLGVPSGDVAALRADIRGNLEREVKFRLIARNKQAALDGLATSAEFDVPKALASEEARRMAETAREDMKKRGMKDSELPETLFTAQATKRVKLGLMLNELVKEQKLQATPEQIKAHIDELAQSYEKPADVVTWYYSKRERLAEVEAVVIENNVTDYILKSAKVVDKAVSFDEVMTA
jgi:trigger factor